MLPIFIKDYTK